jgi:hypothetical protein
MAGTVDINCLDASIAAVLVGKSTVLAKTLLASITALLAVVKAVLVNANCVVDIN